MRAIAELEEMRLSCLDEMDNAIKREDARLAKHLQTNAEHIASIMADYYRLEDGE